MDKKTESLLEHFEREKKILESFPIDKQKNQIKKLKKIANNLPNLKGWPDNSEVFWDDESAIWELRISKNVRNFISNLIKTEIPRTNNHLELGSGSTPYLNNSICLDISFDMLNFILPSGPNSPYKKIQADLEKPLPFKDNSIDSASIVFTLNYIKDIESLLKEIRRILKPKGKLFIIQSNNPVDNYHIIKEKSTLKDINLILNNQNLFKIQTHSKQIDNKSLIIFTAMSKKAF